MKFNAKTQRIEVAKENCDLCETRQLAERGALLRTERQQTTRSNAPRSVRIGCFAEVSNCFFIAFSAPLRLCVKKWMNVFNSILVLAAAFLAVFGEAAFQWPRHLLGAQVDLLPALMIYAALNTNVATVSLLAVARRAVVRRAFGQSARHHHSAAVRRRLSDLSAARFDSARAAVRPVRSRRGGQRGGAGAVLFCCC